MKEVQVVSCYCYERRANSFVQTLAGSSSLYFFLKSNKRPFAAGVADAGNSERAAEEGALWMK